MMAAYDVDALAALLYAHALHASMNVCACGQWRAIPGAGSLVGQHRRHVATILAQRVKEDDK